MMNMKFACVAAGVPGRNFAEQCAAIARADCGGVETIVFPDTPFERWQAEVRAAASDAGIELVTVILGGLALHRTGQDAYVRESMQAIAELGARVLLTPEYAAQDPLPIFPPYPAAAAEEHARVRAAMRTIGRSATELHCAVHVEPITQFESRFCRSVADAAALCAAAESAHVSLVLDTHNMNITEASIVESMRTVGDRIGHMHFADSNRLPPGHGHIPFGPILATLDELRYGGWISFECAFPGEFGATLRRCVEELRRSVEVL